jgi:hydrogenase maturation factor
MRAKSFTLVVLVFFGLAVSRSASAHHNPKAMYETASIMLTGTITGYEWANPHSIISMAVMNNRGGVDEWHAEFLPPSDLTRLGWAKDTLKPGDRVTMTGRPGKHAQHIMWLQSVVMQDGRKLSR